MRRFLRGLPALLVALSVQLLCSCDRPKVVQGGVTAYDRSSHVLSLRDELPPHPSVELSLAGAEVGAEPAVGDTVRVAYREQGGRLTALRLANISRQAEIGGKPSGKKTR